MRVMSVGKPSPVEKIEIRLPQTAEEITTRHIVVQRLLQIQKENPINIHFI